MSALSFDEKVKAVSESSHHQAYLCCPFVLDCADGGAADKNGRNYLGYRGKGIGLINNLIIARG